MRWRSAALDSRDGQRDDASRRRQQAVAVCELSHALALPAHHLVERARHADFEAFHRAPEGFGVGRFDDEVDVVALDGEVNQPEAESLASAGERALERAKAAMRSQVPDFAPNANGDMQRATPESPAAAMGNRGAL